MPEEKAPPRPHGDKLGAAIGSPSNSSEENQAQVQSDAAPDALGGGDRPREETDRERGRGSSANGIRASDEDDGAQRKRQCEDGAKVVSEVD